jgi:DNA-binding MarR family transcriptional regulator
VSQGNAETDPERDDSLSEGFGAVARRLRQASMESLARWDVTPSQWRALRVLTRHVVMRPSELSEHLRIAARSATEVIDSLEAKGLTKREADPQDRRATLVSLTEHGTELMEKIRSTRGTEAERVFDRLSPADRVNLARILRTLLD